MAGGHGVGDGDLLAAGGGMPPSGANPLGDLPTGAMASTLEACRATHHRLSIVQGRLQAAASRLDALLVAVHQACWSMKWTQLPVTLEEAAEAKDLAHLAEGVAAAMAPVGKAGGAAGVEALLAAPRPVWDKERQRPEGVNAPLLTRILVRHRLEMVHYTLCGYETDYLRPASHAVTSCIDDTATAVGAVERAMAAVAIAGRHLDGGGGGGCGGVRQHTPA